MDPSMTADQDQPVLLQLAIDAWNWFKIPLTEMLETTASSYVGQMALKLADKFLWLIEKSSQWALPPPPTPSHEKTVAVAELTRPLPWILFLPTLLMLRFLREGLSLGALIMGKEPVRPSAIVKFVQNCRRNLRALKYHGMRNMRSKGSNKSADSKEDVNVGFQSWIYWVIIKLQSMMCYNAVKYEHGYQPKAISRKNSGEALVVTKTGNVESKKSSSPEDEDEDCDTSILRKLVQDLEEFIDSDSDDSDFSLKNEMGNDIDTSATSSDEENEGIGHDQPEDEQFSIGQIEKMEEILVNGKKDATSEIVSSNKELTVRTSQVSPVNNSKVASKDEDNSNGLMTPKQAKLNPPIIKITPTSERTESKVLVIQQPEKTKVIQNNKENEVVTNSQSPPGKSEKVEKKGKHTDNKNEAKKEQLGDGKIDHFIESKKVAVDGKTVQIVNGNKEKPVDEKKAQTVEDKRNAVVGKTEQIIDGIKEKSVDGKTEHSVDGKKHLPMESKKQTSVEDIKDGSGDIKKDQHVEGKKDQLGEIKTVHSVNENNLNQNDISDSFKQTEIKPNDNSKSKSDGS
ncbi:jabba isoform X2 [Arctopsyche grandis]|uniref:jabba isoform X2 n=1 Tax=Arctopsyche grandis TaxID=121162 RepID=UPI00406D8EC7